MDQSSLIELLGQANGSEAGESFREYLRGGVRMMLSEEIGPAPVPKQVTQLCQEMWDIGGIVVKTSRGWRLLEVWSVSP